MELTYDEIKSRFTKGNVIKSLKDGKNYTYKGFMTRSGGECYDSFNTDLVLHKDGTFAEIVAVGINPDDEHQRHIENVLRVRRELGGISNAELLQMDYRSLL